MAQPVKSARTIAIAIGMLVLAGGVYFALGVSPGRAPDGEADRVAYVCRDDGHTFGYTPRELEAAYDDLPKDALTDAKGVPCPKCNKLRGYRADLGKPPARDADAEIILPARP